MVLHFYILLWFASKEEQLLRGYQDPTSNITFSIIAISNDASPVLIDLDDSQDVDGEE